MTEVRRLTASANGRRASTRKEKSFMMILVMVMVMVMVMVERSSVEAIPSYIHRKQPNVMG